MTIQDMKTRTALYDFLDNTQAALNKDYVNPQPAPHGALSERVLSLIDEINKLKTDLDNGVID
jgi:hypothetical protein